jgi:hypothetical protein
MKFILFLVSVVCVAPLAQIQAQDGESHKRIPVFFSCNCADEVGKLYATALRDLLAKSPRYIESASPDLTGGAVDGPPKLSIVVTSIDPTGDGRFMAHSEVGLLGASTYLYSTVGWCPKTEADHCAASTLAALDDQVHRLLDARAKDKSAK